MRGFQDYLNASPVPVENIPFMFFPKSQFFVLGHDFGKWLETQIVSLGARLVVLDSLTALRPDRRPGGDIVKVEHHAN